MRLFPLGVVILCNMVSRSHIDQTALLLKKANFALQFHSTFNNKALTYEQKLDQIPLIKEKIDVFQIFLLHILIPFNWMIPLIRIV